MGYYIHTTDSDFYVAKSKQRPAYVALCALNDRDDLKRGGSWGGDGVNADSPRPAGMDHHPAKWFSWMAADYPSKCNTLGEVLAELGFDVDYDPDDNIVGLSYSSKIGQEALFLETMAPFVRDGSYINWQGEDGEHFRYEFSNGSMRQMEGRVVWH